MLASMRQLQNTVICYIHLNRFSRSWGTLKTKRRTKIYKNVKDIYFEPPFPTLLQISSLEWIGHCRQQILCLHVLEYSFGLQQRSFENTKTIYLFTLNQRSL